MIEIFWWFSIIFLCFSSKESLAKNEIQIDPAGYILYCPCMGRFGNQAEQFLGTLQFAKALNRTLVLPPFIEYVDLKVNFIPFQDVIDVDGIAKYHRVILMNEFLSTLAPLIWRTIDRNIICYDSRNFGEKNTNKKNGCNPFEGSPFKEFWHHIGVREFSRGSLFYKPLHTHYQYANDWIQKFSNIKVLALVGAPSSFPTNGEAVKLQKYVHFSSSLVEQGNQYRKLRGFDRKPYLAAHLRHGLDWIRACELIHSNQDLKQLFSSQQCLDGFEQKKVTYELCHQTKEEIVKSIEIALNEYNVKHTHDPIEHIYLATDHNDDALWLELNRSFTKNITLMTPSLTLHSNSSFQDVSLISQQSPHFLIDLFLFSYANVFVGNCISSFSAFATRYRIYNLNFHETTRFFAFHNQPSHWRDEL